MKRGIEFAIEFINALMITYQYDIIYIMHEMHIVYYTHP